MIPTLLLLFTLSNIARAESGVDDCSESAVLVRSEGAVYVEGVGCVIDDIGELCKEKFDSDCESWVQVVARVEAEHPEDADTLLKDCTRASDHAHRYDASTTGLTTAYFYDDDGFIVGASLVSGDAPFCCDGVETPTLVYGDPAATCVLALTERRTNGQGAQLADELNLGGAADQVEGGLRGARREGAPPEQEVRREDARALRDEPLDGRPADAVGGTRGDQHIKAGGQ